MTRLLIFSLVILWQYTRAQVHPNAHAHNDYEHQRPLFDALACGFASVEADVHLIAGELYVSHNRPRPAPAITLEKLYLEPLDSLCRLYGAVHKGFGGPFLLLIDIKTDATATLEKLTAVMKRYPSLFPRDKPQGMVQAIISGNRNYDLLLREDLVCIDGRPNDLGKGFTPDKMPVISDHFGNWIHWNGKGEPNPDEIKLLEILARRVHAENKRLRLWAIPDREEAWQVLLDAGVDLINTDRLEDLGAFLAAKN